MSNIYYSKKVISCTYICFLKYFISKVNHMGVLFCDTFNIVTVSLSVALDSIISLNTLLFSRMCLSRSICVQ